MNAHVASLRSPGWRSDAPSPRSGAAEDRLLNRLVVACVVAGLAIGAMLDSLDLPPRALPASRSTAPVTFLVVEPAVAPEPVIEPVIEPEPEPQPIPELTPETLLAQAVDRPAVEPEPETVAPAAAEAATPEPEAAPRRVYGVRKVFSQGLGVGATGSAALVVKRGNTLDGRADTLTATAADLQGELVPLSTVTRAPRPVERHKPDYSETLRQAGAQGTVTARLLIDVDGGVRRVEVLRDIGGDSRELAIAAFEKFRFEPALREGRPVAVWITHKIRFEFQE